MSVLKIYSNENEFIELKYQNQVIEALNLSSFLKGLLNDYDVTEYLSSNQRLVISELKYSQLLLFESFIKLFQNGNKEEISRLNEIKIDYFFISDYQINEFKDLIFHKFPCLKSFYNEELRDSNMISKYYDIADFLGIQFLEILLLVKVAEMYKSVKFADKDINEQTNKSENANKSKDAMILLLRDKYFSKCQENIEKLDKETIDKILKEA